MNRLVGAQGVVRVDIDMCAFTCKPLGRMGKAKGHESGRLPPRAMNYSTTEARPVPSALDERHIGAD